jgi:8-oxo-dGTP pyrophosphatase MutT (NUDIX family)
MERAAAIIIKENQLILIKRIRNGSTYYLFPGGKVEENESLIQACVREVKEELGLNITIDFKLCEVLFNENIQHYFVCQVQSGTFGTGDGEEYNHPFDPLRGIYEPVWIDLLDINKYIIQPKCVIEKTIDYINDRIENAPYKFIDLGNGICVPYGPSSS